METNPYAASHLPAENTSADLDSFAWTDAKIYRDGSLLVKHCSVPFPPICVRTGQPATETVEIELTCIGEDDLSIYNPQTENLTWGKLRSFLLFQPRRYKFSVPISRGWKEQHVRGKIVGKVCMGIAFSFVSVGLLAMLYENLVLEVIDLTPWALTSVLLGIALLIVAAVIENRSTCLKNIVHIQKGYFYISGADKRMLSQLFDSPTPLSWWRRILF